MRTTFTTKKEEVIHVLNTAFAEQNLEEKEYESRLTEVLRSTSGDALEVVIFDFPQEIKNKLFPKPNIKQDPKTIFKDITFSLISTEKKHSDISFLFEPRILKSIFTTDKEVSLSLTEELVRYKAIFGTQKIDYRKCRFEGNNFKLEVESIFSNTTLDLRNQNLAGKHMDIFIKGVFNILKIYIPHNIKAQKNVQIILGKYSVNNKRKGYLGQINEFLENESTAFTITLHGNVFLGALKVIY